MADSRVTDLTEESTPALNDELYLYDVTGTDDNKVLVRNIAKAHTGTSFPSTELFDGYPFYRTDLNIPCFYDGANWVTETEYVIPMVLATYSAGATVGSHWIGDVYQPKWTRFEAKSYVSTTNDGSNYWAWTAYEDNLASSSAGDIASGNTAADSISTHVDQGKAPDTATHAAYGKVYFTIAKVSSPGDIIVGFQLRYRLIIP